MYIYTFACIHIKRERIENSERLISGYEYHSCDFCSIYREKNNIICVRRIIKCNALVVRGMYKYFRDTIFLYIYLYICVCTLFGSTSLVT